MVAWAAASPRGGLTAAALAAADAATAAASGKMGGLPASMQSHRMAAADAMVTGADKFAPVQLPHLLTALRSHVLARSVDGAWLQRTYPQWRGSLRAVMADSQVARQAAEAAGEEDAPEQQQEEPPQSQPPGQQGEEEGGGSQVEEQEEEVGERAAAAIAEEDEGSEGGEDGNGGAAVVTRARIESLLAAAADWCVHQGCVTVGTMSLLRQVRQGAVFFRLQGNY
jgi:hypothetical protein